MRHGLLSPLGPQRSRLVQASALVLTAILAPGAVGNEPVPGRVEFNRDVRPILSENCFPCHGPDRAKRKANLRLDTEAGARADLDGHRAVVAGKLDASELYQRITAKEDSERMPPKESGRALSGEQVTVLERWIEQGAEWQKHWSFLPPRNPVVPALKDVSWLRNPVDAFIASRLEREGLKPAAEANRATLIRRVTLDLTGLPPTPADVDAFVTDPAPDAYEKVVDRLLRSPRYGERMAVRWLDAARYADTSGYQTDGERFMWRWRDWVINAFNANMPFDQFTVEQVAGDLLPNPSLEQRIATGFNRNHRGNAEGGIIPEEYAVEYVVDRVETTATVWLGLTMGCARCHDHKFDPIAQKEFYQVFAFFNNVPERGKALKYGNSVPYIKAPTSHQREQLAELDRQLDEANKQVKALEPDLERAQRAWESRCDEALPTDWSIQRGALGHFPLDGDFKNRRSSGHAEISNARKRFGPGRIGLAVVLDESSTIAASDVGKFGFYDKFSIGAWIKPEADVSGSIVSRMKDVAQGDGYALALSGGKVQINLIKRWLDDAIRVESERRLAPGEWHHVLMTYDGSREARGVKLYIDGKPERLRVALDDLNQSFLSEEPLRIGSGGGPEGRFKGAIDDVRIFAAALATDEVEIVATPDLLADIVRFPAAERSPVQERKLRAFFIEKRAPESIREAYTRRAALAASRERFVEGIPTTMVMEEMATPRKTFVLVRGEYNKPGERVFAATPAGLSPWPEDAPRNRLGLARWLVDPRNPLTARVAVNRYWQMLFGTGLVKTVDDFGSQGELPKNPELLDWLATEFVRTGWDVKGLLRTMVTSATYRQSSKATAELLRKDPDNRLLARGPRVRLSAEMIRDQALAASGLLVEHVGGPSVKPYQPPGLWKELTEADYQQDHGESLYRRSLYTFWKRTVAPPSMMTFDASGRETCSVRELRTNTPLQALTLINDVTFVEAARAMAERVIHEAGSVPEERVSLAFRLATGRSPKPAELKILVDDLRSHLDHFRDKLAEAHELVRVGESAPDLEIDARELAAYTALSSLILNLDETITKE